MNSLKITLLKPKISVIGCGWLGFPLAKKLIKRNYEVHGSTTSKAKLSALEAVQIIPFLIQFTSEGIVGNLKSCLKECQTLIVNIPPGLRKNPESDYVKKMESFVNHIENSSVENVVFIGSTSVYEDEENFPVITENSPTSKASAPKQLIAVETLFQTNKNFKTTILRFSGLYGPERHPATYLSGKSNIKNPEAPVNLIHRNDCIAIIISIIENNIWNTVFNASNSTKLNKKEFYTKACQLAGLVIPEFDNDSISTGKIIDSRKLIHNLNYNFQIKL